MSGSWRRPIAVALVLALGGLTAACGGDDDAAPTFERRDSTFERPDESTDTTLDPTAGIDLDGVPVEDQDDVIIEASIDEIEEYWDERFSDVVGGEFQPVSGGFFPYGPERELPECGGPRTYEEIAGNAFYCPGNDLIAWDTDNLTNGLLDQFGPFTLVIVMAHEYGHAIQARGALQGLPTIAGEQQADCFAGSFTAFVADGGSDVLQVSVDDLDQAVAGILTFRDQPGVPNEDPSAHGSGFDRVGAFQDGFLNGPERCAEYQDIFDSGESTAVEIPLTVDEQGAVSLDAPFDPNHPDSIFLLTLGSLETFWAQALPEAFDEEWTALFQDDRVVAFDPSDPDSIPECNGEQIDADEAEGQAFTCFGDEDDPSDDVIVFDLDEAFRLYNADGLGDFAVSSFLSRQYSYVAQQRIGDFEDSKDSFLQADCFSGAWAGFVKDETISGPQRDRGQELLSPDFDDADGNPRRVSLSAGDLDEAIASFLLLGQDGDDEREGTPFERVTAFRDGFFNGLDSCATYLTDGPPGADEPLAGQDG
jgi:predicted metalloprotease